MADLNARLYCQARRSPGLDKMLKQLELNPYKRQRLLHQMARKVATLARDNTRSQRDVDGAAFKPRAHSDPRYARLDGKRGRMLKKIAQARFMKTTANPNQGKVYWQNGLMGSIARIQQEGGAFDVRHRFRRGRNQRRTGKGRGQLPARSFLGVSQRNLIDFEQQIVEAMLGHIQSSSTP